MLPSTEELVRLVARDPGRKTGELARALGLRDEEAEDLLERLLDLQRTGVLVRPPLEGWRLAEATDFRAGLFRSARRGGGVVRVAWGTDRELEIYIPPDRVSGAFDGDLVLVKLERDRGRKVRASEGARPVGAVVDVLERGRRLVRGVFYRTRGGGVVKVPGGRGDSAVFVSREDCGSAKEGEQVLVRVLDEAGPRSRLRGKVVLAGSEEGSLAADVRMIREIFDLPDAHTREAIEEAALLEDMPQGKDWPDRRDLRGLQVFTIDPQDAKDFDDAISFEVLGGGRVRLGVHIADVSHYVRPGSAMDREAEVRGTSVYFPGYALHMLPRRLSEGLASLSPGEDRLAKSVLLTFGPKGELERSEIFRSVIRSSRRFTYEEVLAILEGPSGVGAPPDRDAYAEVLRRMAELRDKLHSLRASRGALDFDVPKLALEVDSRGEVVGLGADRRDPARSLIEEFMLAANEAVADYFIRNNLPLLARVHPPPEREKVEDLRILLAALGHRFSGRIEAAELQRLFSELRDDPLSGVIQVAVLQALEHASYAAAPGLHFALATDRYCHFTSPIRRYPDLVIHQILDAHLDGGLSAAQRAAWSDRLPYLAELTSERERRAEEAEREMIRLRLARYLQDFVGERRSGIVVGVHPFGLFVRIDGTLVEGLVPVGTLGGEYYEFDPRRLALRGERSRREFRLGDRVEVELAKVDVDLREITFRLLEVAPRRGKTEAVRAARRQKRKRKGRR